MATRGKKEKEYPPRPANWMYKRGDVYMMDLNPYSGSEQGGIRPAIVVQKDVYKRQLWLRGVRIRNCCNRKGLIKSSSRSANRCV